jgi:glycosyltransferase involved in cell wall biosynthesis
MKSSKAGNSDPTNERWPLVSFLVASYNQEKYTRAAVEGAFSQTYSPLEIILSDDDSPDGTYGIMKEMASKYSGPHKVILNQNSPNRGLVGNVNQLMALSSGEFIVKSDGDDISRPDRVEKLVTHWLASKKKAKLIFSATVSMDEKGTVIQEHLPGKSLPDIMREKPTPLCIATNDLYARGATLSWTRELYDKFGSMSETAIADDSILPFRAAALGDILYIDEPLVYHRVGGMSWLDKSKNARYEKMYGRRIRLYKIHVENKKAFIEDLCKVTIDDAEKIKKKSERYIKEQNYRIDLSKMKLTQLICMIPESSFLSLFNFKAHYIYLNFKYIFYKLKYFEET